MYEIRSKSCGLPEGCRPGAPSGTSTFLGTNINLKYPLKGHGYRGQTRMVTSSLLV